MRSICIITTLALFLISLVFAEEKKDAETWAYLYSHIKAGKMVSAWENKKTNEVEVITGLNPPELKGK